VPTIVSPLSSILPNIPAFAGDGSAVSSYFPATSAPTNITTQFRAELPKAPGDHGGNHFFDGPNPRTQTR
jgi:hypothetical protein